MALQRLDHCTNCSAPLSKEEVFCPWCGQKNIDRKVSLFAFFREFLAEYTRLDARLMKSLISLISKPGHLTKEFWAGRRKAYLKPIQLFLFTGLVAFLLFNGLLEINHIEDSNLQFSFNSNVEIEELAENNFIQRHIKENLQMSQARPDLLLKKILSQLPMALLIVLPFFSLFLKALYRKKSPLLVEHFVHLLHLHAFTFIVAALFSCLSILGIKHALIHISLLIIILGYVFLSMRRVYEEKTGWLILKFIFLFGIYIFLIPAGSFLISLLGGILF